MRTVEDPISCLPAAAGIFTKDDLGATTTHGTVRLVAVFIVAIQRLREVLLQTGSRGVSSRWDGRGRLAPGGGPILAKRAKRGVVGVKGYLALYTKTAFEQRVPNRSLRRSTRQTEI